MPLKIELISQIPLMFQIYDALSDDFSNKIVESVKAHLEIMNATKEHSQNMDLFKDNYVSDVFWEDEEPFVEILKEKFNSMLQNIATHSGAFEGPVQISGFTPFGFKNLPKHLKVYSFSKNQENYM